MQRSQLLSSLFCNTAYDLSLNEFGHFAVASIVKKMRIERTIHREVALKELATIKAVFDQHQIKWFITHGTCLGAVRDKDFIPYDSDIDIGCYKSDIEKIIHSMKVLRDQYGFIITKLSLDDESIAVIKENVVIDISLYRSDGTYWQANRHKVFQIPYRFLATLDEMDLLGIRLRVPGNVEAYLEYQYGKEWRTPIKDFYSPYRRKIKVPLTRLLKYIMGEKYAGKVARYIASAVKRLREGQHA